jgi:hypothetical protein
VHDPDQLAKLPMAEQQPWRRQWAEINSGQLTQAQANLLIDEANDIIKEL